MRDNGNLQRLPLFVGLSIAIFERKLYCLSRRKATKAQEPLGRSIESNYIETIRKLKIPFPKR